LSWQEHIPNEIANLYDVHDHRHAAAILSNEFPDEFEDLVGALSKFRFIQDDVTQPGGNESKIPKKFSEILRPRGWVERRLNAKLLVDEEVVSHDSHKVDYIKGRVAFDLEWNSKDQTFDRDLYAFRAFFEYNRISVGVLVTRSNELDPWINSLGTIEDRYGTTRKVAAKYGASTTHMRKLLPRLEAGRSGGCPVLVLGITTMILIKT
jgi:hypothetical protein